MLRLVVDNHSQKKKAEQPPAAALAPELASRYPIKFKPEGQPSDQRLADLDAELLARQRKDAEFISVLKIKQQVLTHLRQVHPEIADCATGLGHLDGFLVVLAAKGRWHGLQLKIRENHKSGLNKPDLDPLEADWLARALQNGFAACVVEGEHEALEVMVNYWFGRENEIKARLYKG